MKQSSLLYVGGQSIANPISFHCVECTLPLPLKGAQLRACTQEGVSSKAPAWQWPLTTSLHCAESPSTSLSLTEKLIFVAALRRECRYSPQPNRSIQQRVCTLQNLPASPCHSQKGSVSFLHSQKSVVTALSQTETSNHEFALCSVIQQAPCHSQKGSVIFEYSGETVVTALSQT